MKICSPTTARKCKRLHSIRALNRDEAHACGGGRFAKFGVGRRQWQIKPIREREVRRIVIREVVGLCKDGQFEDLGGRLLRGPKLIPSLSPNKTWAGFLVGSLAAAVCVALYIAAIGGRLAEGALVGFALALVGHAGDLFESWLKRRSGRKNSGGLIPGHGGVLDRIDSMLFAAPLAAFGVFVLGLDPLCGGHP